MAFILNLIEQAQLLLASSGAKLVNLAAWWLLAFLVMRPLEMLWPIKAQKVRRKDFSADLAYYFLGGLIPAFFLLLTTALTVWLLQPLVSPSLVAWISDLPLPLRVLLALLVGDLGYYWAHRLQHQLPFLWQFHVIHHSPTELDWLVNTRSHPLDFVVSRAVGFVPVFLLGLAQPSAQGPDWVSLIVASFSTLWACFVHANVRLRLGWFEQIFSSPAFHHWHHANDGPASINKNYAALFPWLDRIFGSYHLPARQLPQRYGVQDAVPEGLWAQLTRLSWRGRRQTLARAGEGAPDADPPRQ